MGRSLLVGLVLGGALLAAEGKDKPEDKLSDDEKALVKMLNKARAKEKLEPLKINPLLCRAARLHSENMAKQEKMAHVLDGKSVGHRVTAVGYDYKTVLENLAVADAEGDANKPPAPAADIHKGWMESKSHRANILDRRPTEVGIGVVRSKKGNYYYTQVLALPRKK
jgi:uncharacterized protein YkwD